ncbi:MAG: hypothetical protein Q4G19_07520 [Clostridia bacterium]|nr:hypothetical protein [Clostridia bacterium]
MSKQEQLMEYTTQDIVSYIMEDNGVDMITAMHLFFSSLTYEKLLDPECGLYRESSAYVYAIYNDECLHGKLTNQ